MEFLARRVDTVIPVSRWAPVVARSVELTHRPEQNREAALCLPGFDTGYYYWVDYRGHELERCTGHQIKWTQAH